MSKELLLVLAFGLLCGVAPHAGPPLNLLHNPRADEGTDHWYVVGNAATETVAGNRCFVLRNGARLHQDVLLTESLTRGVAVLIGRAASERVEPTGVITGLPYLYGMMLSSDGTYVLAHLQGQQMRAQPAGPGDWVKIWGLFPIPEGTARMRFYLSQAERKGVPQNGSAARFDDLGLFVFETEAEARAFAAAYY